MAGKDEFLQQKDGGKVKWPVQDHIFKTSQVLVDNSLIRRPGVKVDRTPEQEIEWIKCKLDPIYFIETYCRILTLDEGVTAFKLYDYQKEMIRAYATNRFCVALTARQMGKTTTVAAFLLWYMIFHDEKQCAVLANKADQAMEIMDRFRLMYEELPFFIQLGATKFNFGEVLLENKSKVFSGSSNPDTVRGKSLNLVYWDEAAFTARDEEFWNGTFPVLSSSEKAKIILTSTPKGARGVFFNIWKGATVEDRSKWNEFVPIEVKWNRHPKRDEAWRVNTIAKTSPSQFAQEHECKFLGSSGTLIPANVLEKLQWSNPLNDDEYMYVYEYPQRNRRYLTVADVAEGVGQDYSVATVFDITTIPYKVVAKYRNNSISPLLYPYTLMTICNTYNECPLLIEANNDVGGQVSYITFYELEYPEVILTSPDAKGMGIRVGGNQAKPGVKTTKKVKMIGCANLKTLLENGSLLIEDQHMIEELGTFVAKGNSYEADENCHDDTVMTLVLFSWLIKQPWFQDVSGTDIQNSLYESNINRLKDELDSFHVVSSQGTYQSPMGFQVVDGIQSGISFEQWMMS